MQVFHCNLPNVRKYENIEKSRTDGAFMGKFFFSFVIRVSRPRWPLNASSSNAKYKLLLNNYTTVTNNYFKRSRTKYKQKL